MRYALTALAAALTLGGLAEAKEGMWTPDQLPEIAEDLRATGLELESCMSTEHGGLRVRALSTSSRAGSPRTIA